MTRSLNPDYLDSIQFSLQQTGQLRALGEYRGKQELFSRQRPEVLKTLTQSAIIDSSESSNRIEGIVAPRKKIEKLVLRNEEPSNRSESEIAGYKRALDLIHDSAESMPITTNLILQLHSTLYSYLAFDGGKWKSTDNDIVELNADGSIDRVRFKALGAVETPYAMEDLIVQYQRSIEDRGVEPLIVIPLFILDFLCIHPFGDGNGRTARLLTLILLYHHGYEVGRYISLERVIEDSKESYYSSLEHASAGWHEGEHDVSHWLDYFWGMMLVAHKEFESRVEEIASTPKVSKRDMIQEVIATLDKSFAVKEIMDRLPDVSREMVKVVVTELKDEGVLRSVGRGRGARLEKLS